MGKLAASEAVGSLLADNHLPYTIVEDQQRKTVAVKTHTGELISAEALVVRPGLPTPSLEASRFIKGP